ncbi:MAG TPA: hypothetical protein DCO77_11920 [Nitrospiraceae bacterium]|nr:hypothetical protein [Nitrospiraceae bacterium]
MLQTVTLKKQLLYAGISAAVLFALFAVLWFIVTISNLPDVSLLEHYRPPASAKVLDKDGNILTQYGEHILRIPITELPFTVIDAVVIAEDDTFFEHNGVNYRATWNALVHDVKKKRFARGGSTITQQMIKNVFLSKDKTLARKLREYILAGRAERKLTKRRILEIYVNEVQWGENLYGIEAASRFYFDKHASELTVPEAALLAGMLPNPRRLNPFTRFEKIKARQEMILFNMVQSKVLTEDEFVAAMNAPLALRKGPSARFDLSAPSGTDGLPCYQKVLVRILLSFYEQHELYRRGITITTTLDKDLQNQLCAYMQDGEDPDNEASDKGRRQQSPKKILVVKEGAAIRAFVCSLNHHAVRGFLESDASSSRPYDILAVSVDTIRKEEIVLPTPKPDR